MNFSDLAKDNGLFCDGDWIEKKDQDPVGTIRLIQLADIGVSEFKDHSRKYVNEETAKRLNCTRLQKGDILIARLPDPLGRACIFPLEGDYITAVDVAVLRLVNNIKTTNKYIMHMINSPQFRAEIEKYESGTTRKRISRKNLDRIQFQLPPLAEQQRIVARIEELFSQLDSGEETLRKTKQQLAVYRQAVLKEAFVQGKGWKQIPFISLLFDMRNGYGIKPDDEGEYRLLRISSVRAMNVDLDDYRLNKTPFEEKDTIKAFDLLFTRYNGSKEYVGVCAYVKPHIGYYAYPDKIIRCRLKEPSETLAKYLQYYLNQGEARQFIRDHIKTTSGQNGISGSDLKKMSIWIPDNETQRRIIEDLENKLSVCDSIEQTVDAALQQAEALRQSILKKAFEGGLI